MARTSKPLSERPPAQRALIAVLMVLSLCVVAAAERDIQRRPADQVRGRKSFWRAVSLNALGAISYFRWGRRTAAAPSEGR